MTSRIYLPALGLVNALGHSVDAVADGLFRGDTTGLVLEDGWIPGRPARIGRARASDLPAIPEALAAWDCRNNRLLLQALAQIAPAVDEAVARYGRPRIGVVLGTSTSGVAEGEAALAHHRAHASLPRGYAYTQQEIGMPGPFLARYLGLGGPAYTVSTACTSSAKAFASARRLLRHGLCDAVLVGGVDSLCRLTVNGFTSLESTSPDVCNPMSRHRRGINIGEGAALFLMTREPAPVELLGIGESSDAHHISAPHPEGLGAELAMRAALADARLPPATVGYLNLHATATPKNDQMESLAVARVFADGVCASGTKPLTGHTLGAAGATELAFCWLAVTRGLIPPHIWDGQPDPELAPLRLAGPGERFAPGAQRIAMSNSFAFGGSNASLLVGLCPER